jgi:hypothetical protein
MPTASSLDTVLMCQAQHSTTPDIQPPAACWSHLQVAFQLQKHLASGGHLLGLAAWTGGSVCGPDLPLPALMAAAQGTACCIQLLKALLLSLCRRGCCGAGRVHCSEPSCAACCPAGYSVVHGWRRGPSISNAWFISCACNSSRSSGTMMLEQREYLSAALYGATWRSRSACIVKHVSAKPLLEKQS